MASITNFGYLFAAWPMTIILQKFLIGKFIGSMLTLWGANFNVHNAGQELRGNDGPSFYSG
jgi:hypothetical protein